MPATLPRLFQPLHLRGVTVRNRIMLSPMAQYCAKDGAITDWHFAHFAKFAMGGTGLVFTEATKVERRGLGTVGDMGLWKDEQIEPLRHLTSFLKQYGATPAIQLNHAGRKAGTLRPWEGFGPPDRSVPIEGEEHWQVVAPSALPAFDGWPIPDALSDEGLAEVRDAFAAAARRAATAGFEVLEIHGAHGYLLHEFLSPVANRRNDGYGGTLANRMRFPLEVTEAVRRAWPDHLPLFFRVSAVDDAGWTIEDTIVLARELKTLGVDAIDCSSAGILGRSPTAGQHAPQPGFQVPYAARVRREAGIATVAVGLIMDGPQAEAILADGDADIIAIGREMLYDPFWAAHAAAALDADPGFKMLPPQYGWWLDRRNQSRR